MFIIPLRNYKWTSFSNKRLAWQSLWLVWLTFYMISEIIQLVFPFCCFLVNWTHFALKYSKRIKWQCSAYSLLLTSLSIDDERLISKKVMVYLKDTSSSYNWLFFHVITAAPPPSEKHMLLRDYCKSPRQKYITVLVHISSSLFA